MDNLFSEREIEKNKSRLLENVIDYLKYECVDFAGWFLYYQNSNIVTQSSSKTSNFQTLHWIEHHVSPTVKSTQI